MINKNFEPTGRMMPANRDYRYYNASPSAGSNKNYNFSTIKY